jgi:hypothetical protein
LLPFPVEKTDARVPRARLLLPRVVKKDPSSVMKTLTLHSPWRDWYLAVATAWGAILPAALLFGAAISPMPLVLAALSAAFLQTLFLNGFFFRLGLDRSLTRALRWGAISGVVVMLPEMGFFIFLGRHFLFWTPVGALIGAAAGVLVSFRFELDGESALGWYDLVTADPHAIPRLRSAAIGAVAFLLFVGPRSVNAIAWTFLVGAGAGVLLGMVGRFVFESPALGRTGWKAVGGATVAVGIGAAILLRAYARRCLIPLPIGTFVAAAVVLFVFQRLSRVPPSASTVA